MVRILERIPRGDTVTVFLASDPSHPFLEIGTLADREAAKAQVLAAPRSDATASWKESLASARRRFGKEALPIREVIVLTDLRAAGWTEEVALEAQNLRRRPLVQLLYG